MLLTPTQHVVQGQNSKKKKLTMTIHEKGQIEKNISLTMCYGYKSV
jgi:hypothetical protein